MLYDWKKEEHSCGKFSYFLSAKTLIILDYLLVLWTSAYERYQSTMILSLRKSFVGNRDSRCYRVLQKKIFEVVIDYF